MSVNEFGNSVEEVQRKLSEILPLVDAGVDSASRVRMQVEADGTKERIAVKSGNPIPRPQ